MKIAHVVFIIINAIIIIIIIPYSAIFLIKGHTIIIGRLIRCKQTKK